MLGKPRPPCGVVVVWTDRTEDGVCEHCGTSTHQTAGRREGRGKVGEGRRYSIRREGRIWGGLWLEHCLCFLLRACPLQAREELVLKLGEALLGRQSLLLAPTRTSKRSRWKFLLVGCTFAWPASLYGPHPLQLRLFRATPCHPSDEGSSSGHTAASNRTRRIVDFSRTGRLYVHSQSSCGGAVVLWVRVLWLVGAAEWRYLLRCFGFICWPWPLTRGCWMRFWSACSCCFDLPCYIGDPQSK